MKKVRKSLILCQLLWVKKKFQQFKMLQITYPRTVAVAAAADLNPMTPMTTMISWLKLTLRISSSSTNSCSNSCKYTLKSPLNTSPHRAFSRKAMTMQAQVLLMSWLNSYQALWGHQSHLSARWIRVNSRSLLNSIGTSSSLWRSNKVNQDHLCWSKLKAKRMPPCYPRQKDEQPHSMALIEVRLESTQARNLGAHRLELVLLAELQQAGRFSKSKSKAPLVLDKAKWRRLILWLHHDPRGTLSSLVYWFPMLLATVAQYLSRPRTSSRSRLTTQRRRAMPLMRD